MGWDKPICDASSSLDAQRRSERVHLTLPVRPDDGRLSLAWLRPTRA